MTSKVFQASWILLLVTNTLGALSGILMALSPQFFMADEMQLSLGRSWSEVQAANPDLFGFFLHDIRTLGFTQLAASLVLIGVVLFYYRKLDKAAWFLCLIADAGAVLPTLILNIPIGDAFVLGLVGFLLLVDIVALILGFQPIFGQPAGRQQHRAMPA